MVGDATDGLKVPQQAADRFWVGNVTEIKGDHAKVSKATIAISSTFLNADWYAGRAVGGGPGRMITGKPVFVVLSFFTIQLAGYMPASYLFNVFWIRHIHNHEPVAIWPLCIFHAKLRGPARIQVCIAATIVEIVVATTARLAGTELVQ